MNQNDKGKTTVTHANMTEITAAQIGPFYTYYITFNTFPKKGLAYCCIIRTTTNNMNTSEGLMKEITDIEAEKKETIHIINWVELDAM